MFCAAAVAVGSDHLATTVDGVGEGRRATRGIQRGVQAIVIEGGRIPASDDLAAVVDDGGVSFDGTRWRVMVVKVNDGVGFGIAALPRCLCDVARVARESASRTPIAKRRSSGAVLPAAGVAAAPGTFITGAMRFASVSAARLD